MCSKNEETSTLGSKRKLENIEEGEEEELTMLDVLKDSVELEEDAKRVLGSSDDKNCTYITLGYAKRQALYACLTCSENSEDAGICLGCSYHCHEDHKLIELYTKRNFKCDCGSKKLKIPCKLYEKNPNDINDSNKYNQNFKGTYCSCKKPYPDPEETYPDEMIQCVVCEDWYHSRHCFKDENKENEIPTEYEDMVCLSCTTKHIDIWKKYTYLLTSQTSKIEETNVDVESSITTECKLSSHKPGNINPNSALFFIPGWRNDLCKCEYCVKNLSASKLDYLVDLEDTISHYESQTKEAEGGSYEEGLKALSNMEHGQQIEAITSYNSMKTDLMEYLKTFAKDGKVVKREDITSFFEKMKSNKKMKVEVPKFCR